MEISDRKSEKIGRRDGERMANRWEGEIEISDDTQNGERKKEEEEREREGEEGRFEETATQTRNSPQLQIWLAFWLVWLVVSTKAGKSRKE